VSAHLTLATAARVLRQLRHDHRTIALVLVLPCVLVGLLAWIYEGTPVFDRIGAPLLGIFPFLVTSVATLRERQSGTLERLMTTSIGKGDLLAGYALAIGSLAVLQGVVVAAFAVLVCGLDVAGPPALLVVVATSVALLGTGLGLGVSAFARTEFQAVQFMPAIVLPQFLLCGLLVPRDDLPSVLAPLSDVLPLSYAVDAMAEVSRSADPARGGRLRRRGGPGLRARCRRARRALPAAPHRLTATTSRIGSTVAGDDRATGV
jgi:ABC-2 type transport system permease protein